MRVCRHRWLYLCLLLLAVTGVLCSSVAAVAGMPHPSSAAAAWHGEDVGDDTPATSLPMTARLPLPRRTTSTAVSPQQTMPDSRRLQTAIFHPPKAA